MLTQVLLKELLDSLPLLHFDLPPPVLLAVLMNKNRDYETIWDLSNRICAHYLPEINEG